VAETSTVPDGVPLQQVMECHVTMSCTAKGRQNKTPGAGIKTTYGRN